MERRGSVPVAPPAARVPDTAFPQHSVPFTWLSLDVHHRGADTENRLLATVLAPLLRGLEAQGAVRAVWGTRFDARGPHLCLLVATPAPEHERVRAALVDGVAAHLARNPAGEPFAADVLERRHRECRGMYFTAADRLPGLAAPDSWATGRLGPDAFPHQVVGGMAPAARAAYWRVSTALFHWAVERAWAGAATAAAIAWVAAVDRALRARGMAETAWRHHAVTLVLPLGERIERDRAAVEAALPVAVGPRNRALFDRGWAEGDAALDAVAGELAGAVWADDAREPPARLRALRTAVHCTLLLLGVPVSAEIPLVLHAWERSLARAEAA